MNEQSNYQNFFNITNDILCIVDSLFSITQSNLAFEKILGFSPSETAHKSLIDFIHPEERAIFQKYMQDLSTSSEPIQVNARAVTKDENIRWLTWNLSKPGTSKYIYAVANDYTLEQESRNLLIKKNRETAEDKAKIDAMLANIGDGIIGVSDGGEILYINQSTQDLLGFSQEELQGKLYFHSIVALDDKGNPIDTIKRPIRNAMMTGRTAFSRDLSFVKKDGTPLPVAITASTVSFKGTLMGGVIVFRDITEEKQIDRMKTEFISLASHQLRTPLSAMKWFTEMLLDGDLGELSDSQKEVIQNINISNERMIELVNSLLNISRIESGRMIVDPEETDIKKILEEVLFEVTPRAEKKNQHIIPSIHANLPTIMTDPKLVRHVVMNLLTNAIKYTPENGEITVIISKDEKEIVAQISDTGYGIPKDEQERVFQKFFRAENIKKVETDGTGLGLYLAKQIVESLGGRIWFESHQGEKSGTTFWVTLPLQGSKAHDGEVSIDS